jgi:hypothetical protein
MKACHNFDLKASSFNVNDKTHCDADEPNGPNTRLAVQSPEEGKMKAVTPNRLLGNIQIGKR